MNKTAKTAMITALTLCVVGMVLSTAGYFAGGKDFNDSSGHVYVSSYLTYTFYQTLTGPLTKSPSSLTPYFPATIVL